MHHGPISAAMNVRLIVIVRKRKKIELNVFLNKTISFFPKSKAKNRCVAEVNAPVKMPIKDTILVTTFCIPKSSTPKICKVILAVKKDTIVTNAIRKYKYNVFFAMRLFLVDLFSIFISNLFLYRYFLRLKGYSFPQFS